jgi:hypothetical protein
VGHGLAHLGWHGVLSTVYTAGLCSLVGYAIFNRLLSRYPSGQVVPWVLLAPVVAMASSWALLGEAPGPAELAGAALLVAGVLIAQGTVFPGLPPRARSLRFSLVGQSLVPRSLPPQSKNAGARFGSPGGPRRAAARPAALLARPSPAASRSRPRRGPDRAAAGPGTAGAPWPEVATAPSLPPERTETRGNSRRDGIAVRRRPLTWRRTKFSLSPAVRRT